MNHLLCEPEPLPEEEIDGIWESAREFVSKIKVKEQEQDKKEKVDKVSLIEETSEVIMSRTDF